MKLPEKAKEIHNFVTNNLRLQEILRKTKYPFFKKVLFNDF